MEANSGDPSKKKPTKQNETKTEPKPSNISFDICSAVVFWIGVSFSKCFLCVYSLLHIGKYISCQPVLWLCFIHFTITILQGQSIILFSQVWLWLLGGWTSREVQMQSDWSDVMLNKASPVQIETLLSPQAFTEAPDVCATSPVFLSLPGDI